MKITMIRDKNTTYRIGQIIEVKGSAFKVQHVGTKKLILKPVRKGE